MVVILNKNDVINRTFFWIADIIVWNNTIARSYAFPVTLKRLITKKPGRKMVSGKNYFQNCGRYKIPVTVKPPDRILRGEEQIVYFNRSKHTLHNLFLRLILNVHKPDVIREFNVQPEYLIEGITIDSIYENDKRVFFQSPTFHYTGRLFVWQSYCYPAIPLDFLLITTLPVY